MKRVVVPGISFITSPNGVTEGKRRSFAEGDYQYYLELMALATRASGTEVWAYCLMPNHVHMIMVPAAEDGLRASLGEAHRRYTPVYPFQGRLAGTSVAGKVSFISHG